MNIIARVLLTACLAMPLAACQKDEAPQQQTKAPVAVPATADRAEWRAYLSDLIPRHMEGIQNQPYVYLVPAPGDPSFEDEYGRLQDKATTDVARGIIRGNMLAYAGHDSAKVADLVVAAFADVQPDTMKGVRVLFVGEQADSARVEQAVTPAGVEYVFVQK